MKVYDDANLIRVFGSCQVGSSRLAMLVPAATRVAICGFNREMAARIASRSDVYLTNGPDEVPLIVEALRIAQDK